MSLFESKKNDNEMVILQGIINLVNELVGSISGITEFNTSELKAISFLQHDKYINELLQFYVKNKKHVKRKHSKELLETLKNIAHVLGYGNELESEMQRNKLLQGLGGMPLR